MRFSIAAAALVLAATCVGTPALALPTVEQPSYNELRRQYEQALSKKQFGDALAIAERIPVSRDDRETHALIAAMRAAALMGLDRDQEAQQLIDQSVALRPLEQWPDNAILWGGLVAKKYLFSLAALDRLIVRHPERVRALSNEIVSFLANQAPKADKEADDNRRLALARIKFGSDPTPNMFAFPAMRILIDRGDVAGAQKFLRSVTAVESLQLMLVMRRYEPFWPQIAATVGPHMEKARAAEVDRARRLVAANRGDAQYLSGLIEALVAADRLDRAIELRAALPTTSQGMAEIGQDGAWAVNYMAVAMHRNGQADEADTLLAMLNDSARPGDGWRVSTFINRLEFLVSDGKFDRANALLEETDRIAQTEGNDYARQLVRRMRFCVKSRLGQTAEAAAARVAMLAHAEDAKIASLGALLCVNDFDEAEALARKFSDDHSFKNALVEALQIRPLYDSDPSVWQKNWAVLRERAYFQAIFAKLGRDMPEDLYFTVGNSARK